MESNELLNRLEKHRLDNRLSQSALADLLGVRFETVNRWLNGHFKPNKIQTHHIQKLLASKRGKK